MNSSALSIFVILLGLILGSFVNVIVARLPKGLSLWKPGSHCPSCKAPVRWYQNIPVISYLALRGRCASCKADISVRYPVIELMTALLFLAAYLRFGWGIHLFLRDFPFMVLMVAITFIDLEHRIIPDKLNLIGVVIGVSTSFLTNDPGTLDSVLGVLVGFGFFYGLAWVYQRMTGRQGIGGGDIKLLGMLGSFVGVQGLFHVILVSSVTGTIVGLLWAWYLRKSGGRGESEQLTRVAIPYGPFLVIGALYWYLVGDLWLRFTTPI